MFTDYLFTTWGLSLTEMQDELYIILNIYVSINLKVYRLKKIVAELPPGIGTMASFLEPPAGISSESCTVLSLENEQHYS